MEQLTEEHPDALEALIAQTKRARQEKVNSALQSLAKLEEEMAIPGLAEMAKGARQYFSTLPGAARSEHLHPAASLAQPEASCCDDTSERRSSSGAQSRSDHHHHDHRPNSESAARPGSEPPTNSFSNGPGMLSVDAKGNIRVGPSPSLADTAPKPEAMPYHPSPLGRPTFVYTAAPAGSKRGLKAHAKAVKAQAKADADAMKAKKNEEKEALRLKERAEKEAEKAARAAENESVRQMKQAETEAKKLAKEAEKEAERGTDAAMNGTRNRDGRVVGKHVPRADVNECPLLLHDLKLSY